MGNCRARDKKGDKKGVNKARKAKDGRCSAKE
jgi:hypothetical protein